MGDTDTSLLTPSDLFWPALAACLLVFAWWGATLLFAVPSFILPSPGTVAAQVAEYSGLFASSAWETFTKVVYGGAVGIAGGFALAVLVHSSTWIRRAVYPYLVVIRVLPKIAIAPLLLIYLGTGPTTAVVFIALITFFPVVVNTTAGFDRVPRQHRDLFRSVNASRLDRFLQLELRHALPDVFAGLKQAVTLAVIGTVVAEWVLADSGLGFLILIGTENLQTALVIAATVVLLGLGLAMYGGVTLLQRWVVGVDDETASWNSVGRL